MLTRAPSVVAAALSRFARALAQAAVLGVGLFAMLLLVVRLVVFPNIDRYRDTITAAIGAQIGQSVEIDALTTGWDGWNPKLVISGLRLRPARGPATADADPPVAPLLELPRVALTVAWTSLPFLDLRLTQFAIDAPRLAVRRDERGVVHIAGIEIDPAEAGDDGGFAEWLLRQPEIIVRDALITWTDAQRDTPQLVLDKVNFRLENRLGRHRFGLTGSPPPEIAAPIDLRGEFTRLSSRDWQRADGRLYVRLDYADLAAWREWLPLPIALERGKGALRAWFTFAAGQVHEVYADLELADVRSRLAPDLPIIALAHVAGRAGWRQRAGTRELLGREFGVVTADGHVLAPTNLSLVLRDGTGGAPAGGRLQFDRLELAPAHALAAHVPLPKRWRAALDAWQPRGTVTHGDAQWQGTPDAPTHYEVSADLAGAGVVAHGAWPGATNLTGGLKATAQGGVVKLDTRNAYLQVPSYLADPVPLDGVRGDIVWTRAGDRLTIRIDDLGVTSADASGKVRARYRSLPNGPGELDLDVALMRVNAEALPRYLPTFLRPTLREWLVRAIKPGKIDEGRLKVKGDLANFPFVDDRQGTFAIALKGRGFGLDYSSRWPALSDVDGEVHFNGTGLRIDAARGAIYGVTIGNTTASIPDFRDPVLQVEGEASGPTADFVRFMGESPVGDWTGQFTRGAKTAGDGHLGLKLVLPLRALENSRATGDFTFLSNQLALVGVPVLDQLNGHLAFTNRELRGRDLTADALGGPVRIAVGTGDGRTRVMASGKSDIQAVSRQFELAFGERVRGTTDWTFALDARSEGSSWTVESPLTGVVIDLPPPLAKSATQMLPMRIERPASRNPQEDLLIGSFGDVAHFSAHRRIDATGTRVDRAVVAIGGASREPDARSVRPGLWLRAQLAALDVDEWLAIERPDARGAAATMAPGIDELTLAGVDIDAGRLTVLGRQFTAIKVGGRRIQDQWRMELAGQEVAGTATWSPPSANAPNGRVMARLARLSPPPAREPVPGASASASGVDHGAAHWPELDVAAETFVSKDRALGRLELLAQPRSGDWRIERLLLANEAGRIEASGAWHSTARPDRTELDVALDAQDGGEFLARFGHPGTVRGAPTRITGRLAWTGDPSDFDYPTLSGALRVEVGNGRFMKIEPGIGKLLGVLSLQALPRRITLDFRDVFSEGFTFDRVAGNVRVAQGVMSTDDLRLTGPSAQVAIAGEADLGKETQRLRVRVQPTLSAGVSAGAALLFLANPVIGAAVGAGSLLAQKVLRDPIEQIFSYEYVVTGGWSDPLVNRGTTATAAVPGEASVK
ncbi:MAG: YhdP family protein [Casimicrobiaceae bacterium]